MTTRIRSTHMEWKRISRAYDEMSDSLGSSLEYYENTARNLGSISGRLLDIGCGQGILLSAIQKAHPGVELFATDVSPVCAGSVAGIARVAVAPAEALPFADGTFDFVTMSLVIEHCLNDAHAVAEVYRCLKPGGRFFISTDNRLWLQLMLICNLFRRRENRYQRLHQVVQGDYTHREFRALLSGAGFTELECRPSGPYPFMPRLFAMLPGLRVHLTKRLWYLCRRPGNPSV